ncbi:MAG: diguanylate cyclase domain-containing protein, partial [Anaerolineales bacterium]
LGQHSINYISGLYQVYNINFLEPAEVPESPISPQPVRDVSLATALGLALGVVLAMMREQLRTPFTAMRNRLALDPASNALTARSFRTVLEEELSRSADDTVALGLIRLNGLNGLIDRLPQPVVRSILREATRILNRELRGADAVGRWADTTLAVMLPNTPAEAAVSTFGRILRALSQPFNVGDDGEVLLLEPSIGVAVRKHPEPARTLVRHTEVALHQADQDTRNLILYRVDPFLTDSVEPQHVPTQTPQPALPAPAVHVQPPALRKRRRSVLDNEDEIVKSARANFLKLTRPEIDEADFETVYSNGFSKS